MTLRRVCVYCASSRKCDPDYFEAARTLGRKLARRGLEVVYGGGRVGLMGALSEGALEEGGKVIGVIPGFMMEREWGHTGLTELHVVEDMHVRKSLMMQKSEAFVALPGGSGTFEELFEVLTWKRLGFVTGPVILANLKGIYLGGGDLRQALVAVDAILTLVPDSPDDLRDRGLIYRELGYVPAALSDLRRYGALSDDAESIAALAPIVAELEAGSLRVH